jgi:hypothetical protein
VAGCLLAACTGGGESPGTEVAQTGFPGQSTAGGKSSGELLARDNQQGGSASAEGTPGIPGGSGGNTGGGRMGGDGGDGGKEKGDNAKGDKAKGDQAQGDESGDAAKKKQAEAEREKRQLAAAMDRVAAHWRERAATDPAVHTDMPPAGVKQGLGDDVPRTEKHGTAPPSEDVKQPTPDDAGATVPADAYKDAK